MSLMDHLLTLYRVDSQVRALRTRLEAAERDVGAQQKILGTLQRQDQELASQGRQLAATIKNLEVETQSLTQRIEKLRGEMNSAQNDKQYSAFKAELKTLETKRGELETRTIAEMERLEQVKQQAGGLATQISERGKIHDVVRGEFEQRKNDCASRLAELERERSSAEAAVPERERRVFHRVADVTEGEAMAEVEEIDRRHREYACSSCRMEIPFAHVATLMSNANALVQCTACTRILFLAEATKEVLRK